MKNWLLVTVVLIQLFIALTTTGTTRSLAELGAFLLVMFAVLTKRKVTKGSMKTQ